MFVNIICLYISIQVDKIPSNTSLHPPFSTTTYTLSSLFLPTILVISTTNSPPQQIIMTIPNNTLTLRAFFFFLLSWSSLDEHRGRQFKYINLKDSDAAHLPSTRPRARKDMADCCFLSMTRSCYLEQTRGKKIRLVILLSETRPGR